MAGKKSNVSTDEMDIVMVTDKFGKTMKFQMICGRYYCLLYHPEVLLHIPDVDMRPDDVYLPAFPRTATHQPLSMAPKALAEKKCRVVYPVRDPRDVAVSLYHAYNDMAIAECQCSFEGFLGLFLEGKVDSDGIFAHYREAEKFAEEHPEHPIHFQFYEETQKDPIASIQKLSDFLGVSRNNDLCRAIADKCHFSKMIVDKDAYSLKVDGRNVFYRKGKVGDWANYFTDNMLADYYRVYEQCMAGSRFYDRYARDINSDDNVTI